MAITATRSDGTTRDAKAPLSPIAAQIVQLASNPDVSLSKLGAVAEADPALAMRLLSIANSPAFGARSKITDVKRAAAMLGVRGLRNLALSLVLSDMVPTGKNSEVLLANSLRRAVACRLVATRLSQRELDSFFTTGLLLESGLLVWARSDLEGAAALARAPAADRVLRERAANRTEHPHGGSQLAAEFGLPEETVAAIRHHHDAEPPAGVLPRVAWVAERLAAVYEGGDFPTNKARASEALSSVDVAADKAEELLAMLPELTVEAGHALQRDMGPQPSLETVMQDANRSLIELNSQYADVVRQLRKVLAEKDALAAQLQAANEQLSRLASTDGLTGLANRRTFDDALRRDLARADRYETPLSLVLFDIDRFKGVNDRYGHQAGDQVIRAFAELLLAQARVSDVAARYGGEEFAAILPNTNAAGAKVFAERIRVALEAAIIETAAGPLQVTTSCGIADVAGKGCREQADELIKRADTALYHAKEAGRNRVVRAL